MISAIENEYRCTIDESTRKAFVVKASGAHYADVIRSVTLSIGTHTTADDLVEAMSECWRIAGGGVSDDDADSVHSDGHETALATMQGITPKREKGGNQTVERGATNAANRVIKGTIAGNWSKMPTRGQEIGCPPEMTLENTAVQIAKYLW